MAVRRASINFLKVLEVQGAGVARPAAACMQFTPSASRRDVAAFSSDGRSGLGAFDRNFSGRSFARQLHSVNQSKADDHETFEYEASKMTAEGGSAEEKSFQEKSSEVLKSKAEKLKGSDDIKDKAEEVSDTVKDKAEGVTDSVKDEASKEADKAKDTFQNVSETATGLKEVGIEAGKAVKRDAAKVAEKVGLKSDS